ncbi:ABC transporter substrate-binding protein [Actinomadura livida]|uniref:Extracellular solute-binding protein n=1 Tax=Actinomadura livida TaxID=79909 RepID=A0A7W7IAR5_9ACTN|nr:MULTISPECIES: extracellular solute-binding protein [Actinomadura]MBB4773550.1 multiple sugar transport system substrate-binding protein [Actinomadura catellatispora]GGU09089.1 sugar ABC transporter substrate-binding protein [Actinomadura livida]
MKRILAAAAATLLAVSATACGGGDDGSGGKTKVVFSYWGNDSRQKLTEAAIAEFEKKNPEIDVEGDFSDWDSYYEKLATKTAAGEAPDVMSIEIRGLAEFANRGILADTAGKVDTAGLDQEVLKAGQVDGTQFAIPTGVNAFPMIVNEKTLEEHGQKLPDDKTWTWDDYIATAQKVTEESGGEIWGTEYNENPAFLQIFAAQRGEQFYAGGKVALTEQTIKDWWALLQKIIDSKAGPGAAEMLETGTKVDQALLATNKSAFGSWWSNQLDALTKGSGQELSLLRMPKSPGATGSGMFLQPAMYYTISAKSEEAAAAQRFVDFLVNDPAAGAILLSDRGLPTNSAVVTAIKDKLSPADQKVLAFMDSIKSDLSPIVVPPKGAMEMEDILKRATDSVLFGKAKPDEAAKTFLTEANNALSP